MQTSDPSAWWWSECRSGMNQAPATHRMDALDQRHRPAAMPDARGRAAAQHIIQSALLDPIADVATELSRVTNLMYLSRADGRSHGHAVFNRTPTEVCLV